MDIQEIQAVFIDRDGTIGGTGHFTHPMNFVPYSFSKEAILLLKEHGIKTFAFNQHRISRGEASIQEFQNEFSSYGIMTLLYVLIVKMMSVSVINLSLECY